MPLSVDFVSVVKGGSLFNPILSVHAIPDQPEIFRRRPGLDETPRATDPVDIS
jgi:hypothetical protein